MKRMFKRALAALVLMTLLAAVALPANAMVYGNIDRYAESSLKVWEDSSAFVTVGNRVHLVMSEYTGAALKKLALKSCISTVPTVAKVTAKGWVKALKAGTTRIRLKAKDGRQYTVRLTVVKSYAPTRLYFQQESVTAHVGARLMLGPCLRAKPATGLLALNKVTWRSADTSVATVDKLGVVTPRKPGKVKITATCGKLKATVTVRVRK